jgi:putative alpha-1,2-mannosidase
MHGLLSEVRGAWALAGNLGRRRRLTGADGWVHVRRHVSLAIKAASIALGALFFCLRYVAVAQEALSGQARLALVDPFIGTGPDGHTFPGATVPFGMVQLSPDTQIRPFKQSYKWASGYRYEDATILGFSHTHFSGSGHSDLGDVLLQPISGDVQLEPGDTEKPGSGYRSRFSHKQERAEPGYYAVDLLDYGIHAELTTALVLVFTDIPTLWASRRMFLSIFVHRSTTTPAKCSGRGCGFATMAQ